MNTVVKVIDRGARVRVTAPTAQHITLAAPTVARIADNRPTTTVRPTNTPVGVTQRDTVVRTGGAMGVQGPRGPSGDESYIHTQSVPAATWEITHNLGQYPAVTVVDSAGRAILSDVEYLSDNALRITFAAPFGGVAYLN